jgi:hypothetical protein
MESHTYKNFAPIICLCFVGVAGLLLIIGLVGPIYHECGVNDCTIQRQYGLYCEDYCVYAHYGPGNNAYAGAALVLVIVACLPLCFIKHTTRQSRINYNYHI